MAVRVSTGYASLILGPNAFEDIFNDGAIFIYSGAQPASADAAPTGTLLARITRNGGVWTPGNPANGLRYQRSGRYVLNQSGHLWRIVGLAEGNAGWCRILPNAEDAGGYSIVAPRIDGTIGLIDTPGDFQLHLPDLAITESTAIDLTQFLYAIPPLGA